MWISRKKQRQLEKRICPQIPKYTMLSTKKIISETDELELMSKIVDFAKEKGMTLGNVLECVEKIKSYMEQNAVLERKD